MNELVEGLKQTLKNEDSRYTYTDAVVNALVSAQIKALREDRKLSQQELAVLIGTKQSGISRLEKADYSTWKIETLRKLARAFGVRLRISFDEFGTLPAEIRGFTKRRLCPRKFEDDPVFKERAQTDGEKKRESSNISAGISDQSGTDGGGAMAKRSKSDNYMRMDSSRATVSDHDLKRAS